jgi:hypothetical protein
MSPSDIISSGSSQYGANKVKRIIPRRYAMIKRLQVISTSGNSSNPRDERRHYAIILHGLKHIGVMETPENVVDEDGGDEAWEHP